MPRHHQGEADKHKRPGRSEVVDKISGRGERNENQEGVAAAKAISDPTAWVLINGVEKIFRSAEEADDGSAGAKRFKILGKEFFPKFLAETDQEKYVKTSAGQFGTPGDVYLHATEGGPLVTGPVTDGVRKSYGLFVTDYLLPALQKK